MKHAPGIEQMPDPYLETIRMMMQAHRYPTTQQIEIAAVNFGSR
jgi:hypothetical protein